MDASLLEIDRDLAMAVPPEDLPIARHCLRVPVTRIDAGPWSTDALDGTGLLAVLVLRGLLLREVHVGDRVRAELLGPGDVLRPWDQEPFDDLTVPLAVADHRDDAALALEAPDDGGLVGGSSET